MAESGETVTYALLDARSNQLAQLLRSRGLRKGDTVAILMENNGRFLEATWAAQRSGLYYTPISSQLIPSEIAYILRDCGATALVTSSAMAEVAKAAVTEAPAVRLRLMCDGAVDDFEPYEGVVYAMPAVPVPDESEGSDMLYSSGTTGTPKGVRIPMVDAPLGTPSRLYKMASELYGLAPDNIYLSPAPLYHAAPLRYCMTWLRAGATVIIMAHFDPVQFLRLIEERRSTHTQVVPTMFVRLLKLPEEERMRYDTSSLRAVVHAAAPCPIPVKQQMIEWWGPIIYEYYAGTESNGFTAIDSEDWLAHPGSVGKASYAKIHIIGEDSRESPPGHIGTVYFESAATFEYHNDPEKTATSRLANGWSTLGDVGYLDPEGYLYLTDRKEYMIISGGVNIFPQEAENVLITHPRVLDAAVLGVPNDDMGEEVKAVVQLVEQSEAGAETEQELIAYCKTKLASYKCPRSIDFEAELPRYPNGKLYKRLLRDRYWARTGDKDVAV